MGQRDGGGGGGDGGGPDYWPTYVDVMPFCVSCGNSLTGRFCAGCGKDSQAGDVAAAGSIPIPPSFKCPITGSMMQDPVVDPEGNTYERRAIEAWLERSQTSPMTRTSLTASMLNSNRALRDAIESFRQMTGSPGARQPVAPQVLRPEEERWAEAETAVCARTLSRAACQCPPAASSIAPLFALFYFSALPPPLSLLLCVCPAPAAGPSALGLVPLEDLLMFIFPFYPV